MEIREAEDEEGEEAGLQDRELWDGVVGAGAGRKRKGKRDAGGNAANGGGVDGDDPWAGLARRREETWQRNLQDVVTAPPELDLKAVGHRRLKERSAVGGALVDVANIPGRVGSLRKREELGRVRRDVIAEYRRRMGREGGDL